MLLLLLALPASATSGSQPSVVDVLEARHTPGFPNVLNITDIGDLLSVSSPEVRRAIERLLQCTTLECLEREAASAEILRQALYNSTGVDVARLRALSDRQLLEMVGDPELRSLLESLIADGNPDPREVARLLDLLEGVRSGGLMPPQAYVATLELLRRSLEAINDPQAVVVERRQVSAVLEALVEASRSGLLSGLLAGISGLSAEPQRAGSSPDSPRGGFGPGVRAPPLPELKPPRVPPALLASALVVGVAVVLFLGSHRLAAILSSAVAGIAWRRGSRLELGGAPLATRLYWAAVRVAERVSGVRMQASMTHREFLSAVEGRLGPLREPFKALTQAYELNRYAGLNSRELEEQALRHYEEMEKGRRGARPRPPPSTPGDLVQS
jgi:hypothetical protein